MDQQLTTPDPFATLRARLPGIRPTHDVGRVRRIEPTGLEIEGLSDRVGLGDELLFDGGAGATDRAEVVRIAEGTLWATPLGRVDGLGIGHAVRAGGRPSIAPTRQWLGRVIDSVGRPLDGRPLSSGKPIGLLARPPSATDRRGMGDRLTTGFTVLDTMLPIARGQRVGLFSGSGVGKSTILGQLARGMDADVCVLALVGERGREVADFVRRVLGPEGMARTVVVAATSDMSAGLRRRCAVTAMAVAERFRDDGHHVLYLCDSVTRLAEAHREVAVAAGEPASLRGFPASLTSFLAALCERAGPGIAGQGDITAVLSVLVAGSDMDEPIADILRGQLDGHVVLSRDIAEAGRFPAVDILRSVSRSLPGAASPSENAIIAEVRRVLAVQDRTALMVSSGLYEKGSDPEIDRAIAIVPRLNELFSTDGSTDTQDAFRNLAGTLGLTLADGG
ncbi:FliI/YscN family ATPase [uncultured Jannaschia sp.]|uniref:FliI/YscN family ATPase n=1 Tax=uncultured Jannaschia sp. TaxID=293347 RepID=UPI0026058258|nr:FliI/YscN family ATPase [uncultured Jannaschia sp.]